MRISIVPRAVVKSPVRFWTLAALVACAPIGLLASGGCSGGSGGFIGVTPTPTSIPAGQAVFSNTLLTLGNGQTGTLNVTRTGNALSGTIQVTNPAKALVKRSVAGEKSSLAFTIPPNIYQISGTFVPPRGFTLTGNFPSPIGTFTLSGQIPTTAAAGAYTLTAGGQTQTGVIPSLTVPTPAATAAATPTPAANATPTPAPKATPISGGAALPTTASGPDMVTLSGSGAGAGANFSALGYSAILQTNGTYIVRVEGTTPKNSTVPYRDVIVQVFKTTPIRVGDSFPILTTTDLKQAHGLVLYTYASNGDANGSVYYGLSGTVTITGATATGFSLSLSNVKISGVGGATGGTNQILTFPTGAATVTYN